MGDRREVLGSVIELGAQMEMTEGGGKIVGWAVKRIPDM